MRKLRLLLDSRRRSDNNLKKCHLTKLAYMSLLQKLCLSRAIFILTVLILVASSAVSTVSDDADNQRYPEYTDTGSEKSEAETTGIPTHAKPFRYRRPCEKPEGKDESDLCAQWRAAEAGENSALWTQRSVWVSIIGSIFLLWQISLTRKALADTARATAAMIEQNRIAEAAQRAWITIQPEFKVLRSNGESIQIGYCITYKNVGSTGAYDISFMAAAWPTLAYNDGDVDFWRDEWSRTDKDQRKYSLVPGETFPIELHHEWRWDEIPWSHDDPRKFLLQFHCVVFYNIEGSAGPEHRKQICRALRLGLESPDPDRSLFIHEDTLKSGGGIYGLTVNPAGSHIST